MIDVFLSLTVRLVSKSEKVLFWQKLGSFGYLSKGEARKFLEKSALPPSCESPLNLQRRLV
jgi:hypothetical protein